MNQLRLIALQNTRPLVSMHTGNLDKSTECNLNNQPSKTKPSHEYH